MKQTISKKQAWLKQVRLTKDDDLSFFSMESTSRKTFLAGPGPPAESYNLSAAPRKRIGASRSFGMPR